MLDVLIIEIGITYEQFMEQVERGLKVAPHRKVFEQLLIVDNFQVFKKLMVKRNKEIELEVIQEIAEQEKQAHSGAQHKGGHKHSSDFKKTERELEMLRLQQEKAQIEAAIEMSLALNSQQQKLIDEEEHQLQEAIRQSKAEYESTQLKEKQKQ